VVSSTGHSDEFEALLQLEGRSVIRNVGYCGVVNASSPALHFTPSNQNSHDAIIDKKEKGSKGHETKNIYSGNKTNAVGNSEVDSPFGIKMTQNAGRGVVHSGAI
jgi:hypothetical protein